MTAFYPARLREGQRDLMTPALRRGNLAAAGWASAPLRKPTPLTPSRQREGE